MATEGDAEGDVRVNEVIGGWFMVKEVTEALRRVREVPEGGY